VGQTTNRIVMTILFLGTILVSFNHCIGPVDSSKTSLKYTGQSNSTSQAPTTNSPTTPTTGGNDKAVSIQAFSQTMHPITQARCVNCHGSFQQPLHAVADATQAHDAVIDAFKVNFDNIPSSRMVAKLRDESHNCWSNCADDADEMERAIEDWKAILDQNGASTGTDTTPTTALITNESLSLDQELDPDRAMNNGTIMLEAASAMLTSPMVLNGDYMHVPDNGALNNNSGSNTAGRANFYFDTPYSAAYKIYALVNAPSNNDNSFFVRVNNGNYAQWHVPVTSGFEWREVTHTTNMSEFTNFIPVGNSHRLEVKQREDGTQLQRVIITDDPDINLNEASGNLTVTITYDISALVGTSATFSIDVQEYDSYSYKLSNPTITSNARIRVQNIKPLINGSYNPQHATYTLVDTTTNIGSTVLSPRALLALKDQGLMIDRLSFSFEVLTRN